MRVTVDMATRAQLHDSLALAVPDLQACCLDGWCLIGSAAAWLAGATVTVADVDILTSLRDADVLIDLWQCRIQVPTSEGAERFRSRFARFGFPGLAVEVMGGMEAWSEDGWSPVLVDDIVHVRLAGLTLPIPTVAEQIRLLQSFGRPKDQRRAMLLQSLCAQVQPDRCQMPY